MIFEDFLNDIDNLMIPEDLKESLNKNPLAKTNFELFSESVKKRILFWIKSAKRPETRIKRIEKVVMLTAENKKPF